MTVLSRGARVRRGGRRPGWVLLTALLVLAIGASSALVFTDRIELVKLAVLLALWAAIAGAFVSVIYRRQSDADRARVHDLKLVYDLQLDREISARREYELTVESQLRRELASELHGQAADEVAALRAELAGLRTSLEILFDTDLRHRPALETPDKEVARALSDRSQNGESPPTDWVSSDRVTPFQEGGAASRAHDTAIIDVPEVGVLPHDPGVEVPSAAAGANPPDSAVPLRPAAQSAPVTADYPEQGQRPYPAPESPPHSQPEPRHRRPASPLPEPPRQDSTPWHPATAQGSWLPLGAPGSHWAVGDADTSPAAQPWGPRRARHSGPGDHGDAAFAYPEPTRQHGESGRRSRSRHVSEYREYGHDERAPDNPAGPHYRGLDGAEMGAPPPPPSAAASEPSSRHRSPDLAPDEPDNSASPEREPQSGGQSVADLLARLQVQPSGGGGRRRRDD